MWRIPTWHELVLISFFTLFLYEPDHYAGGELMIHHPGYSESFKLPAGYVIVYPSSLLHQIEQDQSGQRLVAVGFHSNLKRLVIRWPRV